MTHSPSEIAFFVVRLEACREFVEAQVFGLPIYNIFAAVEREAKKGTLEEHLLCVLEYSAGLRDNPVSECGLSVDYPWLMNHDRIRQGYPQRYSHRQDDVDLAIQMVGEDGEYPST